MNDIDPMAELRAADPFPTTVPQPRRSADQLFEEITMNTDLSTTTTNSTNSTSTSTSTSTNDPISTMDTATATATADSPDAAATLLDRRSSITAQRRRRWRPAVTLPAAAAVAGLFTAGAVLLDPGSNPSAYALVTEAAQNAATYESGRVSIVLDLVEVPGEDIAGRATMDYRYDGEDYAFVYNASELFVDGAAFDDDIEIRAVGDTVYSSYATPDAFVATDRDLAGDIEIVPGFGVDNVDPESVVGLLRNTDDFEQTASDGDTTTYRGTLTLETLAALEATEVPAGLSFLVGEGTTNDDLPDDIGVEVSVSDGVLDTLTIRFDGPTPTGDATATITTTFAEFGEAQSIAAPSPDQITDDIGMGELPEGFEEAFAVLDEVNTRRPGLCTEVWSTDTDPSVASDAILAEIAAYGDCLDAAGEPDAADAFRFINDTAGVITEL